jgi:hypothetical protein
MSTVASATDYAEAGMSKYRRAILVGTASTLLAASSAVGAGSANADDAYWHPDCRQTAPGRTLGSSMYGAEWVNSGRLVAKKFNEWGEETNCQYEGDRYRWVYGGTTTYMGKYRWWDPSQVYNTASPLWP